MSVISQDKMRDVIKWEQVAVASFACHAQLVQLP